MYLKFWDIGLEASVTLLLSLTASRPFPASPARSGGCRNYEAEVQKLGAPQTACAS